MACFLCVASAGQGAVEPLPRLGETQPRSMVFILADDHRYDALGFMGHPFLETPHLDRLAREGAHFRNAFVTTALCSPSRATILTGVYPFKHRIVDNNTALPAGTIFFPQYLQRAGFKTAFIGKWHMGGESDDPQPGFDRWVSFRGQGTYLPSPAGLNVDGKRVPQKGYITDELTDYAVDWVRSLPADQPFFLYLSHKAVHAEFIPAERHRGRYMNRPVREPVTQANTPENYNGKPMWVKNQRNSWHGVDFPYHSNLDVAEYYRQYCETLLAVDDSIGRLLGLLEERGQLDSTLVVYMGDNGFLFGEHGLIDKRVAYEESMKIPLLARCPELFPGGSVIEKMAANLDIAPTFLAAAGLRAPERMDGRNLLPVLQGKESPWRDFLLYAYYWERNFPHTPTMHAIRTDRWKFIRYYGLWDLDELYDLMADPQERRNLILASEHQETALQLRHRLFEELERINGMNIPMQPDRGSSQDLRLRSRGGQGEFPEAFLRDEPINRQAR
jgi:N-acetylglucosamine-6-sulfatase